MTIRLRLALGFIAVILLANSVLFTSMERHIRRTLVAEAQTRVASDLSDARQICDDHGLAR